MRTLNFSIYNNNGMRQGGNADWRIIRPFFNGMNLNGYTYTGGAVAVADADGALQIPNVDVPSIEGGRFVDAATGFVDTDTEGAALYDYTLVRGQKFYTDADPTEFPRIALWGASTNKCTCRKANPVDTSNITKTGDAAAVLSVVDDTAALAAAGLDKICTSGKVYKLDNSGGSSGATFAFVGQAGNTNAHSFRVHIRVVTEATGNTVFLSGGEGAKTLSGSGFVEYISENITPGASTRQLAVQVGIGGIVYAILPQLEELPYCTPPIFKASDGTDPLTALTRQATRLIGQSAGVIRGNNLALMGMVIPGASGQTGGTTMLGLSAEDYTGITTTTNTFRLYKGIETCILTFTHQKNVPLQYQAYLSSSYGMGIRVRSWLGMAWSAWTAWATNAATADAPIASTFEIGSRNNTNRFVGNYPMFLPYFTSDPKAYLENLELAA